MNGLEPLIFCIKQFRLKNGIIKQTPISFPQLNLFLVGKRGNDVYDRKSFNDTHPPTMHCNAQSNAMQCTVGVRQA